MDYNMIIRPLVGAVIGYSTNWLAIKMLFRPREEKRIGNFKVPFTPGVIPRERDRIAKSLGGAVGERLLTAEVISQELLNDNVTTHIKTFVVKELLKDDLSLEDIMKAILKEETPGVMKGFSKTIAGEIGMSLNNPMAKEAIRKRVVGYISETLPYNTIIGEVLDDKVAGEISGLVRINIDGIGSYLAGLANSEPVKLRLSSAIETLVMEKVGALGAMFLNGPEMAESVIAYVEHLLGEEEVQEGLIGAIDSGIGTFRQRHLSSTVSLGLYQEMINGITGQVMAGIYAQVNEADLLAAVEPMVEKVVQKKIHLSEHEKEMIETQVEVLYKNFVEENIGTFLGAFDVSKIVEGEINQFSVTDIESLIFAIVDKELNAITWIGGLLGFVIGMVYVFL